MIAELVARRPRPWAGAAILTGTLLGPPGERVVPAGVEGLPMFLCASRHDDWIALDDALATAGAFESAGASVTFETYEDRGHHINDRADRRASGALLRPQTCEVGHPSVE